MSLPEESTENILSLWDQIADFGAGEAEQALNHLLSTLSELIEAQNATWLDAVRMPEIADGDPVRGWRPRMRGTLHPTPEYEASAKEQIDMLEKGEVDVTTIRNVALAGQYRVNRLTDLVGEEWFDTDYYRVYYKALGYGDAIWAGCPVNDDVEIYFGWYRHVDHPRFNEQEREMVAFALRGLKWFYRHYLLSLGLLAARSPLTPVERNVLKGLLSGKMEKQIASDLNQSAHTTHDHIKNIYQKFGIKNRATLMALWLGQAS